MVKNGSEILVEALVEQGVDTISATRAAQSSISMMRFTRTATAFDIF